MAEWGLPSGHSERSSREGGTCWPPQEGLCLLPPMWMSWLSAPHPQPGKLAANSDSTNPACWAALPAQWLVVPVPSVCWEWLSLGGCKAAGALASLCLHPLLPCSLTGPPGAPGPCLHCPKSARWPRRDPAFLGGGI